MQTVKSHLATRLAFKRWSVTHSTRSESRQLSLEGGSFPNYRGGSNTFDSSAWKRKRFLLLFHLYVVTNCSTAWFASLINQTPAFFYLWQEVFHGCFLRNSSLWLSQLDVIFMPLSHTVQWEFQPIMAPTCSEDEYVNLKSGSEIKFHQVKIAAEISFRQAVLFSQCDFSMTFWMSAILV